MNITKLFSTFFIHIRMQAIIKAKDQRWGGANFCTRFILFFHPTMDIYIWIACTVWPLLLVMVKEHLSTWTCCVCCCTCTCRHSERIQILFCLALMPAGGVLTACASRLGEKKGPSLLSERRWIKNSVLLFSAFFCSLGASIISLSLSPSLLQRVHDRCWWVWTLFWTRREYLFPPKCHGDISAWSLDLGCRLSAEDDNNMKLTFLLAAYQKPPDANRPLMPHGGRDVRGPWSVCRRLYPRSSSLFSPRIRKMQYLPGVWSFPQRLCCLGMPRCNSVAELFVSAKNKWKTNARVFSAHNFISKM